MAFRVALLWLTLATVANATAYRFSPESRATVDARTLGRSEGHYQLELNVPVLEVANAEDGFQRLNAPGLVPTVREGLPELATTGKLFAVPPGYHLRWQLTSADKQRLNNVVPRPAQRDLRCGNTRRSFAFNRAAYSGLDASAAPLVSLERVGSLRGIDLVRVAFAPIRMVAPTKQVEVTTRATVDVWLERTARAESAASVFLSAPFLNLIRTFTVNGISSGRDSIHEAFLLDSESMLVIVADGIRDAINPWIEWKRQSGLKVDVVLASAAGDTDVKIRDYIQKYWDAATPKPTYLLLAGDKKSMPTGTETTSEGKTPSDLRYSLLEGGDKDNVPDIFIGRMIADTAEEAALLAKRWVAYERDVDPGAHYVQGTTIASDEGDKPSDADYAKQIADILSGSGFTAVDSFLEGSKTATAANITNAVNEGRSWLSYFGHGTGTAWGSTNDQVNASVIESSLHNGAKLPVLIDVACMNGAWTRIAKCFGRAWSNHSQGGAIGYYGGSVNISWHPPAVMSVGVAKAHFEKHVETLGGSTLAGQLYLVEQMGSNDETLDNLKWYNLFGDPSLAVRTARPLAARITQSVARFAQGSMLAIGASAEDGAAQVGLSVVATDAAGEVVARSKTDRSGSAFLKLPHKYSGLVVTVTGATVLPSQWRL